MSNDVHGDGELRFWGRVVAAISLELTAELKSALTVAIDFGGVPSVVQLEGLANGSEGPINYLHSDSAAEAEVSPADP